MVLREFCRDNRNNEPTYTFSDNNGGSFLDKYKGQISVIKDKEEFIEENIGYDQQRIIAELAAKLCNKFEIVFDIWYSKYYL